MFVDHRFQILISTIALGLAACDLVKSDEPSTGTRRASNASTEAPTRLSGSGAAGSGASASSGTPTRPGAATPADDPEIGDTGLHLSDVLGFYSGDWGDMLLRREGDEIWGTYQHDEGTLVGQVEDGVFIGWWSEKPTRAPTNDAGTVEFRWSRGTGSTPVALDGRWRYGVDGAWRENWDVTLVRDRNPPSELVVRFDRPEEFPRHP